MCDEAIENIRGESQRYGDRKAVEVLREGGIVIYPTDTIYALGCDALNVRAVERICRIKGINPSKSQSVDYLSGIELGE